MDFGITSHCSEWAVTNILGIEGLPRGVALICVERGCTTGISTDVLIKSMHCSSCLCIYLTSIHDVTNY